jgi:hypothetical protein
MPASIERRAPDANVAATAGEPIDLRDPLLAAFFAWLLPGLGHMYQRRWGKGGLFMACILGTFIYGLWLGGGRVVYASFREGDARYAYLCQVATGLPALPAVVQAMRVANAKAPLWDGFMAPPLLRGQVVPRLWIEQQRAKYPDAREFAPSNYRPLNDRGVYWQYEPGLGDGFMDGANRTDQLGEWHDLGTVFTMIAGLLNVLAVWDAWGGPMPPVGKSQEGSHQDS